MLFSSSRSSYASEHAAEPWHDASDRLLAYASWITLAFFLAMIGIGVGELLLGAPARDLPRHCAGDRPTSPA